MKKLLTTSAIIALVGSSVSAIAETTIKGSIEQTMISTSYDAAGSTAGATALGQETNLSIDSSKELSNGWKLSGGFRLENNNIDSSTIKIEKSGFSIHTGADTGSNIHSNINPVVGEHPHDVISGEAVGDAFHSDAQAHDIQHIGVEFASDMGKVFLNYAPDSSATISNSGGSVGDGGTSVTEIGFQGSLGVNGLNVLIGQETIAGDLTNADTVNDVLSVSYTTGPVAVGFTVRSRDDGSISTDSADGVEAYSIAYKVSDDVSISYEHVEGSFEGTSKTDSEYDQVSIGYNFGGLGVSLDYVTADNIAGTSTDDRKAIQLRTVYSF